MAVYIQRRAVADLTIYYSINRDKCSKRGKICIDRALSRTTAWLVCVA